MSIRITKLHEPIEDDQGLKGLVGAIVHRLVCGAKP